jgi:hypothetical protein
MRRLPLIFCLTLLVGISIAPASRAEIHLAFSLEQMTVEADIIVLGVITNIEVTKGLGKKLPAGKLACTLKISSTLKVQQDADDPGKVAFFTADGLHKKALYSLMAKKAEVLFFFRQTKQAYTLGKGKGSFGLWLLHEFETAPYFVDLASLPAQYTLSAKGFAQPKTRAQVIQVVADTVDGQEKALKNNSVKATRKLGFMEVPFESEAYGALYSGSSCYLYAPKLLFPEAKDGM